VVRAIRQHLQVLARIPLLALMLFVASPFGLGQAIATTIDPCCDPAESPVVVDASCADADCAIDVADPCTDAGTSDEETPSQPPAQDDSKGPCCEVSVASFVAILAVDVALPQVADRPLPVPARLSPGVIVIRPLLNPPQH